VENECLEDNQASLDASEAEGWKSREKNGDRTTGGEEQRKSEKPEGAERSKRQKIKEKVSGIQDLLKKPWT
jgi:hypothetical protein